MYEIVKELVENQKRYYAFIQIEQLKRRLSLDKREILLHDLGAGSKFGHSQKKSVSDILHTAVSTDQKCKFLFHLSRVLKPQLVLELGTSLGISAFSIGMGNPLMKIYTIEGDPQLQAIAQSNFDEMKLNINSQQGSFDSILPDLLSRIHNIDFVFIDGNHTYEATMRYHNMIKPRLSKDAVLIYDDIYWSPGMTAAWQELKTDVDFQVSLDVFTMGLLFKRSSKMTTQDFTIIRSHQKLWRSVVFG